MIRSINACQLHVGSGYYGGFAERRRPRNAYKVIARLRIRTSRLPQTHPLHRPAVTCRFQQPEASMVSAGSPQVSAIIRYLGLQALTRRSAANRRENPW